MLELFNLNPSAFAVDLSDFSIKIVKLKRIGQNLDLASFGETMIPAGLVENGEIKDEKALAAVLRQAVLNVGGEKIRTKEIIASLPEEKIFLKIVQLPKMALDDLKTAVGFEAENHIPSCSKECYLDFEIVEPVVNHLDHFDVLLAACTQKIVDSYLRVFKMAGLSPLIFEVGPLAISRALIKNWISLNPVLLVDLGAMRTNLIIFSGKAIRFTSSLPISSRGLTEALASGLGISFEEAEKTKVNFGLDEQIKVHFFDKTGDPRLERELAKDRQVVDILSPILLNLSAEIKNFLEFYYSHVGHEHVNHQAQEVKRALLSGGGANLKGLDRFFSKQLGISVGLGNPWINILEDPVSRLPEEYLRRSSFFTNALGLALRGVVGDSYN